MLVQSLSLQAFGAVSAPRLTRPNSFGIPRRRIPDLNIVTAEGLLRGGDGNPGGAGSRRTAPTNFPFFEICTQPLPNAMAGRDSVLPAVTLDSAASPAGLSSSISASRGQACGSPDRTNFPASSTQPQLSNSSKSCTLVQVLVVSCSIAEESASLSPADRSDSPSAAPAPSPAPALAPASASASAFCLRPTTKAARKGRPTFKHCASSICLAHTKFTT